MSCEKEKKALEASLVREEIAHKKLIDARDAYKAVIILPPEDASDFGDAKKQFDSALRAYTAALDAVVAARENLKRCRIRTAAGA